MKKKNVLILILFVIFAFLPYNVRAINEDNELTKNAESASKSTENENKNSVENNTEKSNEEINSKKSGSVSKNGEGEKKEVPDPASPIQFCAKTAVIWQIVGWVFLIFKIVIPIILIIFGVLDMFKAIIASKDDEIKKSAKSLAMRTLSAIIIFFIPTLVSLVMGLIVNFRDSGAKADFEVCQKCILNPNDCDTSKDAGKQ